MIPTRIRCVVMTAALASLAACGGEKAPRMATLGEALPNLPFPPNPTIVGRAGGPDALQLTVRSPLPAAQVADYYRRLFKTGGWRLVNDARDPEGAILLLAQQHGTPLWVRVRDAGEGKGTLVELSGGVMKPEDSAGTKTATPAS
jgi:hypothetical protein